MSGDWQQFIGQQSLVPHDIPDSSSGKIPAQDLLADQRAIFCSLDQFGCIQVSGEDAQTFLQGQFSNDVNLVTPELGQLSSYCSPKGRILATFLLVQWQQAYWIIVPRELLEGILNRLRMFVLRAKVQLADCSDTYALLGLFTDEPAATDLPWAPLPDIPYHCESSNDYLQISLPGPLHRRLVLSEITTAINWLQMKSLSRVHAELWDWCDLAAGIAHIHADTQETYTPQMVNLDLAGGVSFKKGCYPGQEVVARTHYLGKVKRRMFRFMSTATEPVSIGHELLDSQKQVIGNVVACTRLQGGNFYLLAVIPVEKAIEPIFLAGDANAALQLLDLPYTVTSGEQTS